MEDGKGGENKWEGKTSGRGEEMKGVTVVI